ncbi:MAG TPA: zinc ribbon domain-containing protein [Dermatophilaceae bacterium]
MTEPTRATFCTQCGTRLERGLAFCTACGTAAGVTEPVTTSAAAAGPADPIPPTQQVEHSAIREPVVRYPVTPPRAANGWRGEPGEGWVEESADADTGRAARGSRSGLLTGVVVLLVLAVVAAAVAFVAIRRTSPRSPNADSSSSTVQPITSASATPSYAPGPTYAPVPSSDLPTQAGAIDALLSMSVSSRAAVVQAAAQIDACTSLARAKTAMTAAATTRETAANNATLPVSALPNGSGLISLLVSMMQASATADRGYAAWADDVAAGGCRGGSATHTANFTAAEAASSQATALKQQFAAAWNPIATQAGLPTRTADQL